MHRVIWQHPHSPPNRALAGAGVGRGSARRPTQRTAGRGQVLVNMLTDKGGNKGLELATKLEGNGASRGQSIPLPPIGRPQQRGRQVDTHTKTSLPPPITTHLNRQGPVVTYSEAASRPAWRATISLRDWRSAMCALKWQPTRKRRRLLEPPLNEFRDKNKRKRPLGGKEKSMSSAGSSNVMPGCRLEKDRSPGSKRNTTANAELLRACPDPITNPLGWCEYEWSKKGDIRESRMGWGTYGAPAPWTIQQLAARMVCSWGLVKAYQWTRQSTYVCPQHPMS